MKSPIPSPEADAAFPAAIARPVVRVPLARRNPFDEGLEKWSSAIKRKFRKRKKATIASEQVLDIVSSVFPSYEADDEDEDDPFSTTGEPTSMRDFQRIVDSVRKAIEHGVQPRMNAKGSSGSYMVKDEDETTVAIFKPADEHPYGHLNPKLAKRLQRIALGRIIGHGRSCLVPDFSHLSEVGASLMDRRLRTYIVPRTESVDLSSPAFFYMWRDRATKPLPAKTGSFQLFARGFTDASEFLAAHPWPGKALDEDAPRHRRRQRSCWRSCCGRAEDFGEDPVVDDAMASDDGFVWTQEAMQDFRIELEKLVVLDYLIRNTDRGLDNFMLATDPMRIVAIDNSLAFPFEHPRGFRDYAFGWLWLPTTLIGGPFSEQTRRHFLPLLTSSKWWAETTRDLRVLFSTDESWSASVFDKQMAVIKGQGLNLVRSLQDGNEGPLELCQRERLLVWDDRVELTSGQPLTPPTHAIEIEPTMQQATEHTPLLSASLPSLPPPDRPPLIANTSGFRYLEDMERRPKQLRRSTTSHHARSSSASVHLPTPVRPSHSRVASSEQRPRSTRQWASLAGSETDERTATAAEESNRIVVIERVQIVNERGCISW